MSKKLRSNASMSMQQLKGFLGNIKKTQESDLFALPAIRKPKLGYHSRAQSLLHYRKQYNTTKVMHRLILFNKGQKTSEDTEVKKVKHENNNESKNIASSRFEYKKMQQVLENAEVSKVKAKEIVNEIRLCIEKRKHLLISECFNLIRYLLDFSFSRVEFQLKGFELLGDIMIEFRDYNNALLYYFKGVHILLII